jgi:ubiquinone/menaquinone biosynthesis C-methylase UbiE
MDKREYTAKIRKTFDTVAEGYDSRPLRFMSESAKHMPEHLNLAGDEHILDVATGTGAVAIQLASHVPSGRVTGVDVSCEMLDRARHKAEAQQVPNVTFLEMDMQSLDFPDNHFDASVCGFGLFFVEDMKCQLSHIIEKTRIAGQIAISSFYEDSFHPLLDLFFNRVEQYGVERSSLAWMKIATEEKCAALFEDVGLQDIRVVTRDLGYYLKDGREWWDLIWWGGFRRFVGDLSPSAQEAFRTEHIKEVELLSSEHGIWLNLKVLYTMGNRFSAVE